MIKKTALTLLYIFSITVSCMADEIIIDNVTFQGSAENILECRKMKELFIAKRKKFNEIEKKYYPKKLQTPEEWNRTGGYDNRYEEEYKKGEDEYRIAQQCLLKLELKLDVVPTSLSHNNFEELNKELREKIFSEAQKIREKLYYKKENETKNGEYNLFLKRIISVYHNHPVESSILVELGNAYKLNTQLSRKYFKAAINCKYPSDRWNFAKQEACKKLAKLYEKNNEYEQAIAILDKWKISEPCGNGMAHSKLEKQFWIWRLSIHKKGINKIRKEMWKKFIDGEISFHIVGYKSLVKHILSLYKERHKTLLEDIEQSIIKISNYKPKDKYDNLEKEERIKFLNILKSKVYKK